MSVMIPAVARSVILVALFGGREKMKVVMYPRMTVPGFVMRRMYSMRRMFHVGMICRGLMRMRRVMRHFPMRPQVDHQVGIAKKNCQSRKAHRLTLISYRLACQVYQIGLALLH